MTTEKMTIHKALCELKTLDARITKSIGETEYVFANKHSNDKVNGMTVAAYCDEIKSGYQRVTDLIKRRDAIKRAVVLSNAVTKVTVGGKEYTVAEAIEMKNHGIQMLQTLLKRLERDNRAARNEANQNNGEMLEIRADEYIKSLYGNTDMKNASEDIKKTRADFIAAQTFEIVDPIGIKAEMERLDLPLYTMESKDPLTDFDAVGFTLQYELSYTNILAMLDLAHIPFYAKDRDEHWPLLCLASYR